MKLLDEVRNLIEIHRVAERSYNAMAALPGYRAMVRRRIQQRLETVRRERCYSVMIELSSACNAKCIFCPHPTMTREKRIMDTATFDLILSRLIEEKITPPKIDLFDVGEPLADRNLFDRIRKLRQQFPYSQICTTSNFALATPKIIDEILSCGLSSLRISLNAVSPELYKKMMALDYDKTVRNIEMLLEKRSSSGSALAVHLSMVVFDKSRDDVRAFARKWRNRVDSIIFQRAHNWFGDMALGNSYLSSGLYACNDLFERIVLLSNGEIAICCADSEGTKLNVRDHRILDLFYSKPFEQLRKVHLDGDISSVEACRDCFGSHNNGGSWVFRKYR